MATKKEKENFIKNNMFGPFQAGKDMHGNDFATAQFNPHVMKERLREAEWYESIHPVDSSGTITTPDRLKGYIEEQKRLAEIEAARKAGKEVLMQADIITPTPKYIDVAEKLRKEREIRKTNPQVPTNNVNKPNSPYFGDSMSQN